MIRIALAAVLVVAGLGGAQANPAYTQAVNEIREAHGKRPLKYSPRLEAAALIHAQDLSARRELSHTGSDGTSPGKRVKREGYRYCYVSENAAMTSGDLNKVLMGWVNSPKHRTNILHRKAREFGMARVGRGYWVMVLAKPGCW